MLHLELELKLVTRSVVIDFCEVLKHKCLDLGVSVFLRKQGIEKLFPQHAFSRRLGARGLHAGLDIFLFFRRRKHRGETERVNP